MCSTSTNANNWMTILLHTLEEKFATKCSSDDEHRMSALELFQPIPESLLLEKQVSDLSDSPSYVDMEAFLEMQGSFLEMEEDECNDDEEEDSYGCPDLDNTSNTSSGSRVSFFAEVKVVEIPSHMEYDPETKEKLWSTLEELRVDAARNAFEFAADGDDWRSATEEEGFAELPTGEMVHPATWLRCTKSYGRTLNSSHRRRRTYPTHGRARRVSQHHHHRTHSSKWDDVNRVLEAPAREESGPISFMPWLSRYD